MTFPEPKSIVCVCVRLQVTADCALYSKSVGRLAVAVGPDSGREALQCENNGNH